MEKTIENLTESILELKRHSSVSFKLEGWPAAAVLTSIPVLVVCICTIKTFAGA